MTPIDQETMISAGYDEAIVRSIHDEDCAMAREAQWLAGEDRTGYTDGSTLNHEGDTDMTHDQRDRFVLGSIVVVGTAVWHTQPFDDGSFATYEHGPYASVAEAERAAQSMRYMAGFAHRGDLAIWGSHTAPTVEVR